MKTKKDIIENVSLLGIVIIIMLGLGIILVKNINRVYYRTDDMAICRDYVERGLYYDTRECIKDKNKYGW